MHQPESFKLGEKGGRSFAWYGLTDIFYGFLAPLTWSQQQSCEPLLGGRGGGCGAAGLETLEGDKVASQAHGLSPWTLEVSGSLRFFYLLRCEYFILPPPMGRGLVNTSLKVRVQCRCPVSDAMWPCTGEAVEAETWKGELSAVASC